MVDREQAHAAAEETVRRLAAACGHDDLVITDVEEFQIEWIFYYNSRRWLETRDWQYTLIGNAPVLVDRQTGKAHVTGTARQTAYHVAEYQAGRHVCGREC